MKRAGRRCRWRKRRRPPAAGTAAQQVPTAWSAAPGFVLRIQPTEQGEPGTPSSKQILSEDCGEISK